MTEQKKRGRPKVNIEAEFVPNSVEPVEQLPPIGRRNAYQNGTPMNEYADRVLNAQAPELGVAERVGRVRAALKNQGYPDLSGLKLQLPPGYERFL